MCWLSEKAPSGSMTWLLIHAASVLFSMWHGLFPPELSFCILWSPRNSKMLCSLPRCSAAVSCPTTRGGFSGPGPRGGDEIKWKSEKTRVGCRVQVAAPMARGGAPELRADFFKKEKSFLLGKNPPKWGCFGMKWQIIEQSPLQMVDTASLIPSNTSATVSFLHYLLWVVKKIHFIIFQS